MLKNRHCQRLMHQRCCKKLPTGLTCFFFLCPLHDLPLSYCLSLDDREPWQPITFPADMDSAYCVVFAHNVMSVSVACVAGTDTQP